MYLHEYQAKALFQKYQIPTPSGMVIYQLEDLTSALNTIASPWVLKVQIHAGGRGEVGGVIKTDDQQQAYEFCKKWLGNTIQTLQTNQEGLPVQAIWIESAAIVAKELYISFYIDRTNCKVAMLFSLSGGMEVEKQHNFYNIYINPILGVMPYQIRDICFHLNLENYNKKLKPIIEALYQLFIENDLTLLEINPFALLENSEFMALDGKIIVDSNGLYKHKVLLEQEDKTQLPESENRANQLGLNYIRLSGNIACMVNGAGLAMATMDIIKLHGGEPANFLDVGGGTNAEKVAEAFKIILSESKVKAILINIFGGIVRCDLIAQGILQALHEVKVDIPVIVRLAGTNSEQGQALLDNSDLNIISAKDLTQAAQKAVQAAGVQG